MKHHPRRRLIAYTFIIIMLFSFFASCTKKPEQRDSISSNTQGNSGSKDDPGEINPAQNGKEAQADNSASVPAEPAHTPDDANNPSAQANPLKSDSDFTQQATEIDNEFVAYMNLPYFKTENTERYKNYKAANPELSVEQVITNVNIGIDNPFYVMVKPVENETSLTVLVNKYHALPNDFKPELVQLDSSLCVSGRGNQYLREEAANAFIQLHEAAKELNMNITAYGTYRSIETQTNIWNNAVNSGRTVEDVDSLNARGGHSEHHTGLAVDVIKNNYDMMDTKEYEWYLDQIHQFGFIIRYPEGKEHITGYKFEPWHLRYVGVEVATEVYNSGLTYEEYYATR